MATLIEQTLQLENLLCNFHEDHPRRSRGRLQRGSGAGGDSGGFDSRNLCQHLQRARYQPRDSRPVSGCRPADVLRTSGRVLRTSGRVLRTPGHVLRTPGRVLRTPGRLLRPDHRRKTLKRL